ncbi:hypothetical protein [Streptomyces sp. NPDC005486]|uniref:hypothetical protein n=1 Tax=Streptomyces sp. NPDC005486 TaxID=3155345 RepID=UPI0033AEC799
MNPLITWAQAHPLPASAAGILLLAVAAFALRPLRRSPAAVLVAALAAVACTAYSADTSWRFAEHRLDMASAGERAAMFAAAELALFACALMARQNLRTQGAPGTPGMLVWFITSVQVIPAYSESGIVGGTVRAVVGPVLAALLWHLAMGIELRHAKPDAESTSLPALLAREARERFLSRLGLAVRDRSAEQITRDRATVKAVALAAKLAETKPGRGRARVARRLSVAVGKAQAGADEEQRAKLLDLLAARRHAASLATIDLPSPWAVVGTAPTTTAITTGVAENAEATTSRGDMSTTGDLHGSESNAVVAQTATTAEPVEELRPLPEAVPTGARLLPLVAREDDQRQPPAVPLKVVIPEAVPWHWKTDAPAAGIPSDDYRKVTASALAQHPREVVTQVIALTPSELLKRAHKLNRDRVSSGQRSVTVDQLRDEFGISRRDATDLRRQVVTSAGGGRS